MKYTNKPIPNDLFAGLKPTGFCWNCGRVVTKKQLFCNEKCKKAYARKKTQHCQIPRHGALAF